MENRSDSKTAISLHLYVPPFKYCRVFDEQTGRETVVSCTFDNENVKTTAFKEKDGFLKFGENQETN